MGYGGDGLYILVEAAVQSDVAESTFVRVARQDTYGCITGRVKC